MLLTSAMPSTAARLAEKKRFPPSVRCRLKPMTKPKIWCLICDGHQARIGTRRGRSTHAELMKTSVRFQAVGVTMVLSNVLDHSEKNFVLRRHFESQIVTNAVG